jgi:hypothetical protein
MLPGTMTAEQRLTAFFLNLSKRFMKRGFIVATAPPED